MSIPAKLPAKPILLSAEKLKRLLGLNFHMEQITGTLESLGFECQKSASPLEIQVISSLLAERYPYRSRFDRRSRPHSRVMIKFRILFWLNLCLI